MVVRFYMNDYCQALQSDGKWYRGTIQGNPFVSNGVTKYRVHLHAPLNKHEMISTTFLRPDTDGCCSDDISPHQYQPTILFTYPAPMINAMNMINAMSTMMFPFADQAAAFANQFMGLSGGSNRLLTPPVPPVQSVVSLKRRSMPNDHPVIRTGRAKTVRSKSRKTRAGTAASTPKASPTVATAIEPAAKRPTLFPASETVTAQASRQSNSDTSSTYERPSLVLLEGPIIRVCVIQSDAHGVSEEEKTWSLPKALLSHFSPFFEFAARAMNDAYNNTTICLYGFQLGAFTMFLEWMYWGSYNAPSGVLDIEHGYDIHAWILGNKLEAAEFQNVAIERIYSQYASARSLQPLTIKTVTYVCGNTTTSSPLRLLLLDALAQNFTNHNRVIGTLEEWDVALQDYPDARLLLLGSFRTYNSSVSFVKAQKSYLASPKERCMERDPRSATEIGMVSNADSLGVGLSDNPLVKTEVKKEPEEW